MLSAIAETPRDDCCGVLNCQSKRGHRRLPLHILRMPFSPLFLLYLAVGRVGFHPIPSSKIFMRNPLCGLCSVAGKISFGRVRSSHRFVFIGVLVLLFNFSSGSLLAADKTWDGQGGAAVWQGPANWDNDTPPSPNDSLFFDGSANTTTDNDFPANTPFNSITFNSGASPFTLNGSSLFVLNSAGGSATAQNIGGGITNNSAFVQTILFQTVLADGKHSIVNNGANNLALGGVLRGLSLSNGPAVVQFLKTGAGGISTPNLANNNGILGGWALFGTNWATADGGGNLSAYTNYTDIGEGGTIPTNSAANVRITAGLGTAVLTSTLHDINSLYYGANLAETINFSGHTLRLGPFGGISRGAVNAGAILTIGTTGPTNGVLTAGGANDTDGEIVLDVGNGAASANTITINSQITDNGSGKVKLLKTGQSAAQIIGSRSNSYSGGTYIAQGRLTVTTTNGLGFGPVYVYSGGQLLPNATDVCTNDLFIAGIGNTESGGNGAIRGQAGKKFTGVITLMDNARVGGGITLSNKLTGAFALEIGGGTNGAGNNTLVSTSNDFSGGTIISAAGAATTLLLGNSEVIPNGSGKGNVTINGVSAKATLNLNGQNETINGLVSAGAATNCFVTNSSATISTLTVGDASTTAFDGSIQGPLNLVKNGSGTQSLGGSNDYTGNTIINVGTLAITGTGSIGSTPLIGVDPGATLNVSGTFSTFALGASQMLKGYGTVVGAMNVNGNIAPGGSVGTINTGNETWNGGGSYTWEINDAAGGQGTDPGWDLINDTGTLTIAATAGSRFNINITSLSGASAGSASAGSAANFANTTDYSWTILHASGGISGFDPSVLNVVSSSFNNTLATRGRFIVVLGGGGTDMVIKHGLSPTIATQPVGGSVTVGSTKTFSVSATGSGTLTYQWRKNGSNIVGANANSYTINSVQGGDSGDYSVVVVNEFGTLTSSTVTLMACSIITLSPSSLSAATVGTAYSQTIGASGGAAAYTFAVTSGSLPGGLSLNAGSGALSGTPTGGGGIYNFTVTATDANGCTGSRSYSLAVNTTLTVSIHSGYNLIANQLDNGGNTLNEIMPGVADGSFLFKYDNGVGSYLTASFAGASGWHPANFTLVPGEGAFLYSPSSYNLTFTGLPHKPVLPLPACGGYRLLSRQTNEVGTAEEILGVGSLGNGTQVFKWNVNHYDTFTYASGVWTDSTFAAVPEPTAAIGEAIWIKTLTGPDCAGDGTANGLNAPPVITTQPQSLSVAAGTTAIFTVIASGSGTLTYQWRLNGINIVGQNTDTLTLNNVQPANKGIYSVVVANAGGATDSKPANLIVTVVGLGFTDNFADRPTTNSASGSGTGSNVGATKEAGEADHAGNPGGASVWYAWLAPTNGIATFTTLGSSFDTVLAVYSGTNIGHLKRVASNDDGGPYNTSKVIFNAVAGVLYNIAMDGSYGKSGSIILEWSLETTADVTPDILTQPLNQTAAPGADVTLSVRASAGNATLFYQWYFNGTTITDATNSTLTLAALTVANVGAYKVRVSAGSREVYSKNAIVQLATIEIGSVPIVAASDKFLDVSSIGVSFIAEGGHAGHGEDGVLKAAPCAGFTGTQIFSTVGSVKEPDEPNHCGEAGGASYWFSYLAPATGQLSVNTSNSTYNTVLAVYRGPAVITDFSNLTSVSCQNITGNGNENVSFSATNATTYYIAVDGVAAATGTVNLGYKLVTDPPVIATQPQSHSVTHGTSGLLSISMASSTTTLAYQWKFGATNISGATLSAYTRSNFQLAHQGNYQVIVTNQGGAVTSTIALMYLSSPSLRATNEFINETNYFQMNWNGPTNGDLILQRSPDLTNWTSLKTNTLTNGKTIFTDGPAIQTNRYYRGQLTFP